MNMPQKLFVSKILGMPLNAACLVIVAALTGLLFTGCTKNKVDDKASWQEHDQKLKVLDEQLQELANHIKGSLGQSKCDSDSQCHVVGLGPKTCGGYQQYAVYSSVDTDEKGLLEMVSDFNTKSDEMNKMSYQTTKCGEPAKSARCVKSYCTVSDR